MRRMALLIKKHMILLGPTAALTCARAVPGIAVADNGDVLSARGDNAHLLSALERSFASFAGKSSRVISDSLAHDDPDRIHSHK